MVQVAIWAFKLLSTASVEVLKGMATNTALNLQSVDSMDGEKEKKKKEKQVNRS